MIKQELPRRAILGASNLIRQKAIKLAMQLVDGIRERANDAAKYPTEDARIAYTIGSMHAALEVVIEQRLIAETSLEEAHDRVARLQDQLREIPTQPEGVENPASIPPTPIEQLSLIHDPVKFPDEGTVFVRECVDCGPQLDGEDCPKCGRELSPSAKKVKKGDSLSTIAFRLDELGSESSLPPAAPDPSPKQPRGPLFIPPSGWKPGANGWDAEVSTGRYTLRAHASGSWMVVYAPPFGPEDTPSVPFVCASGVGSGGLHEACEAALRAHAEHAASLP